MPHTSKIILSAARVVMSPLSNGGETSTMSRPTSRALCVVIFKRSNAWRLDKPPADGISVPGANAGSRTSMSNEMWTSSPATASARFQVADVLDVQAGQQAALLRHRRHHRRELPDPLRRQRGALSVHGGAVVGDARHHNV